MDIQAYIESGAIESCVMGMADEQEQALLASLRVQYPEVEKAFRDIETWYAVRSMDGEIRVPALHKEKLLAVISSPVDSKTESKPLLAKEAILRKQLKKWQWAAAAALIVCIASAVTGIYYYQQYRATRQSFLSLLLEQQTARNQDLIQQTRLQELTAQVTQLTDTAVQKIVLSGVKGKEENRVTLFWNRRTSELMLLSNRLPQAPVGKQYQLWAIVNGKPQNAGLLQNCNEFCYLSTNSNAQAFAITLEKTGGSEEPTLTEMLVLGQVKS